MAIFTLTMLLHLSFIRYSSHFAATSAVVHVSLLTAVMSVHPKHSKTTYIFCGEQQGDSVAGG